MRDELQQLEEEMLNGNLVLPIKSANELIPGNKENDWWVMHFPFNGFNIDKVNLSDYEKINLSSPYEDLEIYRKKNCID